MHSKVSKMLFTPGQDETPSAEKYVEKVSQMPSSLLNCWDKNLKNTF